MDVPLCETAMSPAIHTIVNASAPDSPSLVNIVWCGDWSAKSEGRMGPRLPLIFQSTGAPVEVVDRYFEIWLAIPVGNDKLASP